MRTLMISPIGEPGSGKSTFSLGLCLALKRAGVAAEIVPEVIKHDVFTEAGVRRVTSGRFDTRYLRAQHALTRGFVGRAEVVVNDGALEPFLYYAAGRVPPARMPAFEALLERFRAEQAAAEHRFVALDLNLGYDATGRHQDRATARAIREALLGTLAHRFGIVPTVLRSQGEIDAFAHALVDEALARRDPAPVGPRQRLR